MVPFASFFGTQSKTGFLSELVAVKLILIEKNS